MPPNSEQTIGRQCRKVNIFCLFSLLYGTFTLFRVHICFPIILQCVCHRLTNRVKWVTQVSQTTIKFVFIRKKLVMVIDDRPSISGLDFEKSLRRCWFYLCRVSICVLSIHIFSYICIFMYLNSILTTYKHTSVSH